MTGHVYHEIFLHITWHTKNDQPALRGNDETLIHGFIEERCRKAHGVYLHAIGGTDDHVHLAINIAPHVCISDLVGELKGGSSRDTTKARGCRILEWQRGYGVVSFGARNLEYVQRYIADQRQHHAQHTVQERLERVWIDEEAAS